MTEVPLAHVTLNVPDISCAHCVQTVTSVLTPLAGVAEVSVDLPEKTVSIAYDPQRVTLEVVETEPVTKGQTASSSYKPAILSNGVRSAVPPHIGVGTRIVVMTADGSYVERAKD